MAISNPPIPADSATAESAMPMFYKSPRPLDRTKDSRLKLSRPSHFKFTAHTNAIPLLIDEFPMASAYYPVVFAAGPVPIPAAVVGLHNDNNLFLDEAGQWANGAYLPAYIRRYPFILMDDPEQKQFVLCIDESSDMLSDKGEYPLLKAINRVLSRKVPWNSVPPYANKAMQPMNLSKPSNNMIC